jgi:hypothetical protein
MSEKVLDASKETQKLTTQSKYNEIDYKADRLVFREVDSFSFDNIITGDIELCLNKSRSNADGLISFNADTATNCLKKLHAAYSNKI